MSNFHTPSRKRHLFWPVFILSLIGIHIVSVVTMVVVATHDRSFAVEPDFYQKGLHYEQTLDQRRENARLGWTAKLEVGRPLSGSNVRNVVCRLSDRDEKPLDDAKIDMVAFAHLREPCQILRPAAARQRLVPRDPRF